MPFTSWASHPKTLQREALRVSLRHFVVSEPPPRFCQQQFAALAYLTQIFRIAVEPILAGWHEWRWRRREGVEPSVPHQEGQAGFEVGRARSSAPSGSE